MSDVLTQLAAELLGAEAQRQIASYNPYYEFASVPRTFTEAAMSGTPTTSKDLWQQAAAASVGSLLGGGLVGYGNVYQNTLRDRYEKALASAIAGEEPSAAGMPPGLFGMAKQGGSLWNAMLASTRAQDELDLAKAKALIYTEKPWLQNMGKQSAGTSAVSASRKTPLAKGLQTGAQSTEDRYADLFQSYLEEGQPPQQAAVAAREMLKGEMKANVGSFDKAAHAREYAQGLLELADRAERGVSQAGKTGPGIGGDVGRGAMLYAGSALGVESAENRMTGRQVLDSIKADLVKMKRSPGAVSDYENRMILAGGPTTTKTPEANEQLIQNWKELARYNQDYADFLDAYREVNGSILGAEKLWNEYRSAYPLYKETSDKGKIQGRVITERPSWQEFFQGMGSGGAETPNATKTSAEPPPPKPGESFEDYKKRVGG